MHGALWDRQRNSRFVSKKKKWIGSNTRVQRVKFSCIVPYLISKETTTGLIPSRSFLFHRPSPSNFFSFPLCRNIVSIFGSDPFECRIVKFRGGEVERKPIAMFKIRWRGIWFSRRIAFSVPTIGIVDSVAIYRIRFYLCRQFFLLLFTVLPEIWNCLGQV